MTAGRHNTRHNQFQAPRISNLFHLLDQRLGYPGVPRGRSHGNGSPKSPRQALALIRPFAPTIEFPEIHGMG